MGRKKYVAVGESNYVANFVFLTRLADAYGSVNSLSGSERNRLNTKVSDLFSSATYMYENDLNKMREDFSNTDYVGAMTWGEVFEEIDSNIEVTTENIKLFIYGIAIHAITEVYAHSTFSLQSGQWKRVKHNNSNFLLSCDNPNYIPDRWRGAQRAASSVLSKYSSGLGGDLLDFYRSGSIYGTFYLGNLSSYSQMVVPTQYSALKELLRLGDLYYNRGGKQIVYEGDFSYGEISHVRRPILTPSVY